MFLKLKRPLPGYFVLSQITEIINPGGKYLSKFWMQITAIFNSELYLLHMPWQSLPYIQINAYLLP